MHERARPLRSAHTPERAARRLPDQHRPASLLDFAIVASSAVVPGLIGILVLVAIVRPADPESAWRAPADRYISLRHMAALETFEAAITRRTQPAAVPPTAAQLLAAIPAVIAYNLFVNRTRLFAGELEGFANELIGTMAREGLV